MITLQQLLTIAPFSEETRKELLEKSEHFSDAKEFEAEELCWGLISQWYHDEVDSRTKIAIQENAKQAVEQPENQQFAEIEKIPDKVFSELTAKLADASSTEEMQEVREKLAEITPT